MAAIAMAPTAMALRFGRVANAPIAMATTPSATAL